MATDLQKAVYKERAEKLRKGEKVVMAKIIRKNGGSLSYSRNPSLITKSKGWLALSAKHETGLAENAFETLRELSSNLNEDKNNRLSAAKEINRIYEPAKASKVVGLFGVIKDIGEEDAEL